MAKNDYQRLKMQQNKKRIHRQGLFFAQCYNKIIHLGIKLHKTLGHGGGPKTEKKGPKRTTKGRKCNKTRKEFMDKVFFLPNVTVK